MLVVHTALCLSYLQDHVVCHVAPAHAGGLQAVDGINGCLAAALDGGVPDLQQTQAGACMPRRAAVGTVPAAAALGQGYCATVNCRRPAACRMPSRCIESLGGTYLCCDSALSQEA